MVGLRNRTKHTITHGPFLNRLLAGQATIRSGKIEAGATGTKSMPISFPMF